MSSEQIDTFIAVTSSDGDTAKKYLDFSGGDLEAAITFFFEGGGSTTAATSTTTNTNANNSVTPNPNPAIADPDADAELAQRLQNEAYQDDVRAPDQARTERLVDDGGFGLDYRAFMSRGDVSPPRSFSERGIFNQFENDLIDDEEGVSNNEEEIYDRQFGASSTLTEHQKRLAKLFRPPFDLIERLTLDAAKKKGQQEKKWILINIQDVSDFQCQLLNRDFWSNPSIKQVVKLNFIFLQYQNKEFQAREYIQFNPFTGYPHIAILDPYSGERYRMWDEVPKHEKWLEQIYDFLDRYSLHPGHKNPAISHKKKVDPSSLSEEQQLNLAMKKSMNSGGDADDDSDVEEVREIVSHNNYYNPISLDSDEEESAPEFEDDDEDENAEVQEVRNEGLVTAATSNASSKEAYPVDQDEEMGDEEEVEEDLTEDEIFATILPVDHKEPDSGAGVTRIQIRFGDGTRVVRRFSLNDPVRNIYEVMKANYDQVKDKVFTLTIQRVNLIQKLNETIEEAGLKSSSILVDTIDD